MLSQVFMSLPHDYKSCQLRTGMRSDKQRAGCHHGFPCWAASYCQSGGTFSAPQGYCKCQPTSETSPSLAWKYVNMQNQIALWLNLSKSEALVLTRICPAGRNLPAASSSPRLPLDCGLRSHASCLWFPCTDDCKETGRTDEMVRIEGIKENDDGWGWRLANVLTIFIALLKNQTAEKRDDRMTNEDCNSLLTSFLFFIL